MVFVGGNYGTDRPTVLPLRYFGFHCDEVGYQREHFIHKMEAARSSETFVSYHMVSQLRRSRLLHFYRYRKLRC